MREKKKVHRNIPSALLSCQSASAARSASSASSAWFSGDGSGQPGNGGQVKAGEIQRQLKFLSHSALFTRRFWQ